MRKMFSKNFRKTYHKELEICLYLSIFSKEISQLTDWQTNKNSELFEPVYKHPRNVSKRFQQDILSRTKDIKQFSQLLTHTHTQTERHTHTQIDRQSGIFRPERSQCIQSMKWLDVIKCADCPTLKESCERRPNCLARCKAPAVGLSAFKNRFDEQWERHLWPGLMLI